MQTTLRKWEYYGTTETFSSLYEESKNGLKFHNLYDKIISRENILLAFRSIKTNKGSQTAGVDKITIGKFKNLSQDEFVELIRNKLLNYQPKKVKRVMIPKSNGKLRPLGIPSMLDRLIQQMFKQVLEPIAEAKFYKHSYGFRPLRGAHHAKARIDTLINIHGYHYAVDVDIEGFFDNVNHTILIKQLWNMGIQDKRVLAIISKMLKAPIDKIGIPTKGTPQGGILSPLLANVYLHDLDMWVAGQWELFETNKPCDDFRTRYRMQAKTNLKKGFLIRYADDFKIMCKDSKTAWKWFHAVNNYLQKHLKLNMSKEKSRVLNLRKKPTEFLGFKIKAVAKGKKYFAKSNITDKKVKEIASNIREKIIGVQKSPNKNHISGINSVILGAQNYFKYATHVYKDFNTISYNLSRTLHNRFKGLATYGYVITSNTTYNKYYGHVKRKTYKLGTAILFPIAGVKHQNNMNFSQSVTPFTEEGRKLIHRSLENIIETEIISLMKSNSGTRSLEYMDNRLSRYSMKKGKCEITGQFLIANEVHCHHFVPLELGGDDSFSNLRIVQQLVHKVIHAKSKKAVDMYLNLLKPNSKELSKINRYRKACKLELI